MDDNAGISPLAMAGFLYEVDLAGCLTFERRWDQYFDEGYVEDAVDKGLLIWRHELQGYEITTKGAIIVYDLKDGVSRPDEPEPPQTPNKYAKRPAYGII